MKFTLPKKERLKSKKDIQNIFSKGSSVFIYPFQVIYLLIDSSVAPKHKIMISVPKKRWKRSVDRNLIKRLSREAYRLNKNLLADISIEKQIQIALIYTADKILPYKTIEEKIILILHRLNEIHEKSYSKHNNSSR